MRSISQELYTLSQDIDFSRAIIAAKLDEIETLSEGLEVGNQILAIVNEIRSLIEDPAIEEEAEDCIMEGFA